MSGQTMLYRSAEAPNPELGGRKLGWLIVDDADIEGAEAAGWHRCPDDAERATTGLLDGSAKDIAAALPELTDEALLTALDDETKGKTRKGVIAAIEAEIAKRGGS